MNDLKIIHSDYRTFNSIVRHLPKESKERLESLFIRLRDDFQNLYTTEFDPISLHEFTSLKTLHLDVIEGEEIDKLFINPKLVEMNLTVISKEKIILDIIGSLEYEIDDEQEAIKMMNTRLFKQSEDNDRLGSLKKLRISLHDKELKSCESIERFIRNRKNLESISLDGFNMKLDLPKNTKLDDISLNVCSTFDL